MEVGVSFQRLRRRGASRCGRLAADGVRVMEAALGAPSAGRAHSGGLWLLCCLPGVGG